MNGSAVTKAIEKLASGYSVREVTEEYAESDGEMKLVKRRESRKDVPPDMKAILFLLQKEDLSSLSEEDLRRERETLVQLEKE